MLFTKRSLEGYVRIDHRDSPGFSAEEMTRAGRTVVAGRVGAGQMFEGATNSCSHCSRIVIKNPDRTRVRGYCPKCDAYVCDWCEAERVRTNECLPMSKRIDLFLENVNKEL